MKEPTPEDAKRCLQIRKRIKKGEYCHPEDIQFCEDMYRKYEEWYTISDDEVFNDTIPYGSNVRMKNGKIIHLDDGEY